MLHTMSGGLAIRSHRIFSFVFVLTVLVAGVVSANAQSNEWGWMSGEVTAGSFGVYGTLGTPDSGNVPSGRMQSVSWTDSKGNLWIFGGEGSDSKGNIFAHLNDLWKFSPSTGEWAWMGGSSTVPNVFEAEGVYGTLGVADAGNLPPGRAGAVSWTDAAGNGWVFGGWYTDSRTGQDDYLNDLWKYDTSSNKWTWMSGSNTTDQRSVYGILGTASPGIVPGGRISAVSWTDGKGNLWLFGGVDADGIHNDLWMFNTSTSQWTWVSGSTVANQISVPGTLRQPAPGNVPAARANAVAWIDSKGSFWIFGGVGSKSTGLGANLNDLWVFNPAIGEWAWMSGSNTPNQQGVFGTLQTPAADNVPGSREGAVGWTDRKGNLWMYGGEGFDSTDADGYLNDLWMFNPATNEWAWMGGSTIEIGGCALASNWCGQFGVYGTLHTFSLGSAPGGRFHSTALTDNKGDLWLFGGAGYDGIGTTGYENDLWEFQPNTGAQQVAATPIISPGSGNYTSWQTVTITDATPDATITYNINGSTPAIPYSSPLTVSSSETIKAIASATGFANSNIASASYVENLPQAATPKFSLPAGTYATTQTLTISDTTPGATIYYAIGTVPTTSSKVYTGLITVSAPETVEAIAVADGYLTSPIATAPYNIGTNPSAKWTWMGGSTTTGCSSTTVCGQPGWYGTLRTPSAGNLPGARYADVSWTDNKGNLWLFGGHGYDSGGTEGYLNDLWKFDPASGQWTWMSGSNTVTCPSSSVCSQAGVYGTLGSAAPGNTPGGRHSAVGWTDSTGDLWLFGGEGFDGNGTDGLLNDLWEFDVSTNQWTWEGGSDFVPCLYCGPNGVYGSLATPAAENVPGGRYEATKWTDSKGNFWLYGGYGRDARDIGCTLNDLWERSPSTKEWKWMGGRKSCPNVDAGWPGVYGDLGVFAVGNLPWSLVNPASWTDGNDHLWLFGGAGVDLSAGTGYLNDMWEFDPSINQWAWTSASSEKSYIGVYGTMGDWSTANIPGARWAPATWTDSSNNFWLLGGVGLTTSGNSGGVLNDLWEFKPALNEWSWMGGSSSADQPGIYGTLGFPSSGNAPGGHSRPATWTDNKGNLWMFGGLGNDARGNQSVLNDLWQYGLKSSPSTQPPSPSSRPIFSLKSGTYTSVQTLTISGDPGGTIYYTTNGTVPNSKSTIYSGPIEVLSSETVEAVELASSHSISSIASGTYTINLPVPTFTIAGVAVNVPRGARTGNTSTITVTPADGFKGSVALSAVITSSPAGAQYPPSLNFGSTSPVSITSTVAGTATLTINTTAATTSAITYPERSRAPWYAGSLTTLAYLMSLGIPSPRKGWKRLLGSVVFLIVIAASLASCGGGSAGGGGGGGGNVHAGTTAGTYTITVTGTSGLSTARCTVTLNVQ
jgi:N-acetylneuraminic acid mutarotase